MMNILRNSKNNKHVNHINELSTKYGAFNERVHVMRTSRHGNGESPILDHLSVRSSAFRVILAAGDCSTLLNNGKIRKCTNTSKIFCQHELGR